MTYYVLSGMLNSTTSTVASTARGSHLSTAQTGLFWIQCTLMPVLGKSAAYMLLVYLFLVQARCLPHAMQPPALTCLGVLQVCVRCEQCNDLSGIDGVGLSLCRVASQANLSCIPLSSVRKPDQEINRKVCTVIILT